MHQSSAATGSGKQATNGGGSRGSYIVVEGFGSVEIAPDYGTASFEVNVQRRDLPDARREANKRVNAVLAALDSQQVPAKDIQTSRFSIDIVRDYNRDSGRHIFTGYRVAHTIYVRARPPERLGEVIDAAFEAGATEIGGINFFADDPGAAYRDARTRAANDALAKARQLAELTGVTVGPPLRIEEPPRGANEESSYGARSMSGGTMMLLDADAAPPTTISPGEGPVAVHLRIYFAIV